MKDKQDLAGTLGGRQSSYAQRGVREKLSPQLINGGGSNDAQRNPGSALASAPRVKTVSVEKPMMSDANRKGKRARMLTRSLVVVLIIALITGGAVVMTMLLTPKPLLPKNIASQVSFGIFYPQGNEVLNVSQKSIAYDAKTSLLTYSSRLATGSTVSFSEQSTPSSFVDVPSVYTKLISNLQEYASFDSLNGTVYLTKPKELHGQQAAVLNNRGTLIFARTTTDLSVDRWRAIFNSLQVKHP